MQIETYEAISLDEQHGDVVNELVSEEAMALIESLGLDGQKELLNEHDAGDEKVTTRAPYRTMTAEEAAVFGAVLPRHVSIDRYNDAPIPLRVLQVAAHAKTIDIFNKIEVWCPANPAAPDPLLVAWTGREFARYRKAFILARWGEVLEPLDTLRDKAAKILRTNVVAKIEEAREELNGLERGLDAHIAKYLNGGSAKSVWLNLSIATVDA
jgi:hypothetical protein